MRRFHAPERSWEVRRWERSPSNPAAMAENPGFRSHTRRKPSFGRKIIPGRAGVPGHPPDARQAIPAAGVALEHEPRAILQRMPGAAEPPAARRLPKALQSPADGSKDLSFIKSPYGPGLPVGAPPAAGHVTLTRLPASTWNSEPSQGQPERRSDRQTRDCLRSASTLPLTKCTGDADHRFYPVPSGRERHRAAIQSAERPASPSLVRYEFCRRDNSEHIRD